MHNLFNCRYAIKRYEEHLQAGGNRMGESIFFVPSFDFSNII